MIGSVQSTAFNLPPLAEERPNEIAVQAWLGLTAEGARKASPPPPAPVRRWDHPFANDFWRWQRPQRDLAEDLELAPPPRPIDPGLATYTMTPGRLTPRGAPMLSLGSFAPADPRKGVTFSVLV